MDRKQKILKMAIILLVLIFIIIGAVFVIQWKNGKNKKAEAPKIETPREESNSIPTLDPKLSNEDKAIQIIVNHIGLEKKDLEYLEVTSEGLYHIKNKKETTKHQKIYYLVDIKAETYQTMVTISGGAA